MMRQNLKSFSSLHQLPQPPADSTGCKELTNQLLEDFKLHKGATISSLTGMAGIGKIVLGLEVAHQIADDYPEDKTNIGFLGATR